MKSKPKKVRPADDDPRWTSDLRPAAGELRIVHAFVNTGNPAKGTEWLTGPRALADWLARWGLVPPGTKLGAADVALAIQVRDDLRAVVRDGRRVGDEVAGRLDRVAEAATLRVRFDARGGTRYEPAAQGFAGALARLFDIVAAAQRDGSWARLKLCGGEGCGTVFYDFSRNSCAMWCHPRCGNRLSAARWRRRDRQRQERR